MTMPESTVCTLWATIADVCAPCNSYDFDPAVLEDSLMQASEILFNLTARQWPGDCLDVVRPCAEYAPGLPVGAYQSWQGQHIVATGAARWGVCGCRRDISCGCGSLSVVRLPRKPVTAIAFVKINGQVLDPVFYRIDNWRDLVYLPGAGDSRQGWPCCQVQERGTDEDDTFEIGYYFGAGPPPGGVASAGSLGCQIALSKVKPSDCQLPKRLQTITRQGVTMGMIDSLQALQEGWTGLPDVDMWIGSVRYAMAHRAGAVYNPRGIRDRVRRTTG